MKKYKNNVISMLLSVIMLLCVMPFSVSAAGSYETSTESQLSMLDSNDYLSSENFTIPNGSYFIKNETLNRYLQPDDNNLNVNLTEMELWNFDGNNYQKWELTNLNNGYYKIISAYSGKALSVKSGEENTDSSRIIQETYGGYYRQQWKIELTVHGMWRISPRSGYSNNWCISADDGIFFMNGWHIEQKQYTNNTYYRDEWIICQLPTSGSELKYEPSLWSDDIQAQNGYSVRAVTNCYSYALNEQFEIYYKNIGGYSYPTGTQPGYSVTPYNDSWTVNIINVLNLVSTDAGNWGFTFGASSEYGICSSGTYKVALVIDPNNDYHWYRQNKDGSWSHKRGTSGYVELIDASGEIIYNPRDADRDYGNYNYSQFVGFFEISPTNHLYSNSKSNVNDISVGVINKYGNFEFNENAYIANEEIIDSIKPGMTFDEIYYLIGAPTKSSSSGKLVFEYSLNDNSVLLIQYGDNNNNELVAISVTLRKKQ